MTRPPLRKSLCSLSWRKSAFALLALLSSIPCGGCAAIMNPIANGIPVPILPPELRAVSKAGQVNLPLYKLRQPPPEEYRIGAEDVLGIWIEGILGEKGQPPVARFSEQGNQAPALGFPIPVRRNGTIALPLVPPIKVDGMTLEEAERAIVKAYTVDKEILKPGQERILVTLQQPRHYHILVIRQDSPTAGSDQLAPGVSVSTFGVGTGFGSPGTSTKRGTGYAIDLPVYENDVLNALAKTGGFPGTDAVNEVVIYRSSFNNAQGGAALLNALKDGPPGSNPLDNLTTDKNVVRIPLRGQPGEFPPLKPEDVILKTGDIVFIEARNSDVFYTGGLLPSGEFVLPRDADLDVVEALARAHGPLLNFINGANLSGTTVGGGLGQPFPALVAVVRRAPNGDLVTIKVDLQRAMNDPQERLLVQAKDFIILQERPQDAITRYFTTSIKFPFTYMFTNGPRGFSSATGTPP
jgi:protein involved in polysaccharide export with SLBB domain